MTGASGDDAVLVGRALAGDTSALAEIVRTHQQPALRLAAIICGDPTEAYDIVQESFVKAFRSLEAIRTTDSLRPWLLRIVANEAKNARRSRSRRDARLDRHARLDTGTTSATDDSALSSLEASHLTATIAALGDDDRRIIACRYFAELSEAETADVLGIAKGTVKSRTSRALTRLRSALEARP